MVLELFVRFFVGVLVLGAIVSWLSQVGII